MSETNSPFETYDFLIEQKKYYLDTYFIKINSRIAINRLDKMIAAVENEIDERKAQFQKDDPYNTLDLRYVQNEYRNAILLKFIHIQSVIEKSLNLIITVSFNFDKIDWQWNRMRDFLKSKGINMSGLNFFESIHIIRTIANRHKHHNNLVHDSIHTIAGFDKENELESLKSLLAQNETNVSEFFKELTSAISRHLFEPSNEEINKIGEYFNMRFKMDEKRALIRILEKESPRE